MTSKVPVQVIELSVGAELTFGWDWTSWLNQNATIADSTWTIDPLPGGSPVQGVSLSDAAVGGENKITTVKLSNHGPANKMYRLTCQVEASDGEIDTQYFDVVSLP